MAMLHREVNKLSVMYTNLPLPRCADEVKLFDGATQCLLALVSSIYHLPVQQGKYNISNLPVCMYLVYSKYYLPEHKVST